MQKKKSFIEQSFSTLICNKLTVIVIENRGRDVSALLVATKSFINEYDYVCFAHDKKSTQFSSGIIGQSFFYKCFENILSSKSFVLNVINLFNENPRLGLLTPPPPYNGVLFITFGFEWGPNFLATKELADRIGLKVDINQNFEPVAPLGTMFWFRPQALKALFAMDWKYSDFPSEPNATDGTLLHAIERIYPYIVQHEKFYPAWLLTDSFASMEINNLHYMLREIAVSGMNSWGTSNFKTFNNCSKHKLYAMYKYKSNYYSDKFKSKLRHYLPKPIFGLLKKLYRSVKK